MEDRRETAPPSRRPRFGITPIPLRQTPRRRTEGSVPRRSIRPTPSGSRSRSLQITSKALQSPPRRAGSPIAVYPAGISDAYRLCVPAPRASGSAFRPCRRRGSTASLQSDAASPPANAPRPRPPPINVNAAATQTSPAPTRRTAWARHMAAPVRDFLRTETGSAVVLPARAALALIWANTPLRHSYDTLWSTRLSIRIGGGEVAADLRHWVNEGLMTVFFLVVGLEAKRELDVGDLRERRRVAIPALAAIGGMAVPIAIYLAFNAGGAGGEGWGAALSADTALALRAPALLAPRSPPQPP